MDKAHKKKLKRLAKKKKEKKQAQAHEEHLSKQMSMFDRLPDKCSACKTPFPKTREAHMTWRVTVRNEEQQVRLFCPACQRKAREVMENNNNEV